VHIYIICGNNLNNELILDKKQFKKLSTHNDLRPARLAFNEEGEREKAGKNPEKKTCASSTVPTNPRSKKQKSSPLTCNSGTRTFSSSKSAYGEQQISMYFPASQRAECCGG